MSAGQAYAGGQVLGGDERLPLAVDLDGTLLRTDSLLEGAANLARKAPMALVRALSLGRKAAIKRAIAQSATIDASAMPYNEEVLTFLRQCKAEGRTIGLFTAADQTIADAVGRHLDLFSVCRGSDGTTNLSGARKAQAIAAEFGEFAYIGDSRSDMPVFEQAKSVGVVGPLQHSKRIVPAGKTVDVTFVTTDPRVDDWVSALRLRHWAKNLLVFVPLILGANTDPRLYLQALVLFVAFGAVASSTYLINDLLDLAADRSHPEKRDRALASGRINLKQAMVVSALLLLSAAVASFMWLPWRANSALAGYLTLTLTYSLYLKRKPVADVLALAGLFTSRILAGSWVSAAVVSPWLMSFSLLFFLSLAEVKRYAELRRVVSEGGSRVPAREYGPDDLILLAASGIGAALASAVIFTVYLVLEQYPRHIYGHPHWLWVMLPVLLGWLLRVWRKTLHGQMNEDPVLFSLHDRVSLGLAGTVAAVLIGAWV